jgi:hypothetical protein
MINSEDLEGQKAVGAVLDMVEAMRSGDKGQLVSIVHGYISPASSHDERERLLGILLQVFARTVVQLTYIIGEIDPSAVVQWRDDMRKIASGEGG